MTRAGAAEGAGGGLYSGRARFVGDGDLFRFEWRVVRHVVPIAEQELQRVRAGRELQRGLGLTVAVVTMAVVFRDGLVQRRHVGVDEQVMMPGIRVVDAGGRDAHTTQAA